LLGAEPKLAVAMLTLGSLGTAASDVVVDSIVVERARGYALYRPQERLTVILFEQWLCTGGVDQEPQPA
jgi:hypothetical protein